MCVVPLTLTVPTVAPVSPFTPVIVVGRRVRIAVIGHAVRRDRNRRVRLVDAVGDRAVLVVVVGRAGEAPVSSLYVPAVGVRRVAHVNRADRGPSLTVHTGDRVGRRVRSRYRSC